MPSLPGPSHTKTGLPFLIFVVILLLKVLSFTCGVSVNVSSTDLVVSRNQFCSVLPDTQICVDFQKYISKELPLITLIETTPYSNSMCWSDPIVSWFHNCSLNYQLYLNKLSESKLKETCQNHTTVQPNLVDILFLVELSKEMPVDETKLESLNIAVQTLVDALSNKNYIQSRFGLIVYSLNDPGVLIAKEFMSMSSPKDVSGFLLDFVNYNHTLTMGDPIDITLLQYLSVEKSLGNVLVNLKDFDDTSEIGGQVHLHPQPKSDLHVISLLDMSHPSTRQPSSLSKKSVSKFIKRSRVEIEKFISLLISQALSSYTNHLFLHFVFNKYNKVAARFLGDPSHSTHYDDCSHFIKASTLKALLKSGAEQSQTLQAHLLSKGRHMVTMTWNDFKRKECVLGISPALSTPFGVYPTFRNSCRTDKGDVKPNDHYCSPLHGWIRKEGLEEGRQDFFEGRTPISTKFSASHIDLIGQDNLKGYRGNGSVQPLEKLTVYETREVPCHKAVIHGEPTVKEWSPTQPIVEHIIGSKEPLVLRNTVVQSWKAIHKWNMSYLEERIKFNVFPSVKCSNTFLTFDPDKRASLKLNISIPFVERNMTKESFFNCIKGSVNPDAFQCPDEFQGHYYFGPVPLSLKQDLTPDRFLYHTDKDYKSRRQFIWISSSGMITHIHFDQDFNFFVQLVGKKRFTLWNPFQHELMYTYPRVHPMWHKSQVNFNDVDIEKFPAFSRARAVQIELGPGDTLYIPPYTWHYVETLSPSVSLSTWSNDYNVYHHMNSIYRHDHKFDLIEDPRGMCVYTHIYMHIDHQRRFDKEAFLT